jgi:iron complex outermembrane receptor protein
VRAVSVGVDYFRVRLDNQISQGLAATTILGDPVKYAYLIQRGPVDPAFPSLPGPITSIDQTNLNLGASIVSGFDLDLKWRLPASELGRFTISATGTYFNRFDTENLDGSFTGGVDVVNTATGGIVPRLKTYVSVDWTQGPWNVNLAQNFQKGYDDIFSSTQDPTAAGFQPRHVGSYITYDAQASYTGFKSVRLTLGVRNLLDRDPPYSNVSGRVNFQGGYDVQYADPRGRFVYARASYQF